MTSQVTLDGITFKLMDKSLFQGYKLYHLISSASEDLTDPFDVHCYRSRSEAGMLRLAYYIGSFEKGYDYVQSTLIDIRLQSYINDVEDKLPFAEVEIPKSTSVALDVINIGLNYQDQQEEEPLGLTRTRSTQRNQPRELLSPGPVKGHPRAIIEPHLNVMTDLKGKNASKQSYFSMIHKWPGIPQEMVNELQDESTGTDHLSNIFLIMSRYMETHFEIEDVQTDPTFVPYVMEISDTVRLHTIEHIHVTLSNRHTGKIIVLVCVRNIFENDTHPEHNSEFKSMITIIDPDTRINKYGLYDRYYPAGRYVHKVMEYIRQLPNMFSDCRTQEEYINLTNRTVGKYMFVADLVQVWPLTTIP